MSHITRIKTKIINREYLLKALDDLNLAYEEGEFEIGGFGSSKVSVQIRIKLPWSYDIGLRQTNGSYEIIADWWGVHGLKKEDFTAQLLQRYAYHAAIEALQRKGFSLASEEQQSTGEIHLVLRKLA